MSKSDIRVLDNVPAVQLDHDLAAVELDRDRAVSGKFPQPRERQDAQRAGRGRHIAKVVSLADTSGSSSGTGARLSVSRTPSRADAGKPARRRQGC